MENKTEEETINPSEDITFVSEEIDQEPLKAKSLGLEPSEMEYGEDWNNDSTVLEFPEYEKALENENNNNKHGKKWLKAED